MIGSILGLLGNIFEPASKLIDDMHTSDEEKITAKTKLFEIRAQAQAKLQEYETELLKAQSTIIQAEATSQSWLARNWRPMTMVTFVVAVMAFWFGLTPDDLDPAHVTDMFTLVKIGLGGYVVGRSGEKIAKSVAETMKNKK